MSLDMAYTGGIRQRLITDSLYNLIRTSLEDLGWYDAGREHLPIQPLRTEPVGLNEEIPLNTIILNDGDTLDDDAEMGSSMGVVTTTFYVDFYAEDREVGKQLIHDVRDVFRGRMPDINRTRQVLDVYDWSMATPEVVFTCDLESVVVDQARDFPKPWQRNWWMCRVDVVDVYDGE